MGAVLDDVELGPGNVLRDVAASGWTFHLLSQVVERTIEQNRLADAERMMARGVAELEEQLDEGVEVEPSRVLRVAECAARLGCALRTARWLEVSARLHDRVFEPPSQEILTLVDELPNDPHLKDAIAEYVKRLGRYTIAIYPPGNPTTDHVVDEVDVLNCDSVVSVYFPLRHRRRVSRRTRAAKGSRGASG